MNASEQSPDPLVGRILQQRYRVVERLSEGAMGVVYRGERLAIQRPVAIKFLHAAVAEQENLRRRFEVEARAMGRLSHPNCVSVIDFGVDDVPYVVMDFVDGRSLRDILNGGGISAPRALNVGRQLLTALVHAHAQGIIHRDIKPENMMLQQSAGLEDHVRVLDFGMAKITNHSAGLTAGFVLGTPNYMAPEQAQESDIDARADLYSAAIVIFELLTNQQPFAADTMGEILRRQLQMPAPALRAVMPAANFSAALEAVLLRAMAKQPSERFATAAAMLDALEAVPECKGATVAANVASVTGAATTLPAQPPGRRLPPPPFKGKTPPVPATPNDATRLDLRAPSGAVAAAPAGSSGAASAPAPEPVASIPSPAAPSPPPPTPAPPPPSASDQLTMQLDGLDDLEPPLSLVGRAKQGAAATLRRTRAGTAAAWAWAADKSRRPYEIGAAAVMLLLIGVLLLSRGGSDDAGLPAAPGAAAATAPQPAAKAPAEPAAEPPAPAQASAPARETAEPVAAQDTPKPKAARGASRTSAKDPRWTQARSAPPAHKPAARSADAPLRKATPAQRWGTHWGN